MASPRLVAQSSCNVDIRAGPVLVAGDGTTSSPRTTCPSGERAGPQPPGRCARRMTVFVNLWRLLDRRQRRRLVLLQVVSLLMAVSTVSGIAAVLPFFTVLTEPNSI